MRLPSVRWNSFRTAVFLYSSAEEIFRRAASGSGRRRGSFRWTIMTRNRAQRNGHPVPEIDHGDGQRQVHDFLFAEMFFQFLEKFIGRVGLGDTSDGFSPGKRGSFAVGKKRCLMPGIQRVKTLFGFA